MAALREINRRPSAAGGFPYEAYVRPSQYARLDPNIFDAYDIPPMRYLQEEFVCEYCYEPIRNCADKCKRPNRAKRNNSQQNNQARHRKKLHRQYRCIFF